MSRTTSTSLATVLTGLLLLPVPAAARSGDESARTTAAADPAMPAMPRLVEQGKLTANDGATADSFGVSVALAGDIALVGTRFAAVDGNDNQGAVYVFTRGDDTWSLQAKLTADDGEAGDEFGISVALGDDIALVGAFLADVDGGNDQGAAYVFTRSGDAWSQRAKLVAQDGSAGDRFGRSVALAGDTALVGADDDFNGSAYVFTGGGDTWSQQAKLIVTDPLVGFFGVSVALAGDTALVGAFLTDVSSGDQGAAYVFTRSGDSWSQQARLTADDSAQSDELGVSVALAGDIALVGARRADVGGIVDQGAAYVFTRSGESWSQQAKLTADDGAESDRFGVSVALTGDTALVGAFQAEVGDNSTQGAAYVFTHSGDTWSQQAKLTADDGMENDRFGSSVALVGDTALVGAPSAAVDGNDNQGAAYVFGPLLTPEALAVDPEPMASADGNGVFEPGEMVDVGPSWRNNDASPLDVMGTASGFTGPPDATYTLAQDGADYGTLDPGQSASCLDTGTCYVMGVNDPTARPAAHWDATFDETLDPDGTARTWTLHLGDSFTDVPRGSLFYTWIETLLHNGVTGGCDDADYCPASTSTRGQMPAFVLRALLGPEFTPEPCVEGDERFDDVPAGHLFCPWIEELAERGVVAGCGGGDYCPDNPVTRAQMAIFLLHALEGADFTPQECEGVFADVDCPSIFADWVEELFNRGVTGGCGEEPLRYCPSAANTRSQMAVFLSKTFGLTLYGP